MNANKNNSIEKYYCGIGSRDTPLAICNFMTEISKYLSKFNIILRSGGAAGADSAFELGATRKEIFLPWNGFNKKYVDNKQYFLGGQNFLCEEIVKNHVAHYDYMKHGSKKLHKRNVNQIYGQIPEVSPLSSFVICWTLEGKLKGGTATALKIANSLNIKVFNLAIEKDYLFWNNKIYYPSSGGGNSEESTSL